MTVPYRVGWDVAGVRDRLRAALGEHGSATRAAIAVGWRRQSLANVVSGYTGSIPLATLLKLEAHLGVDLIGPRRAELVADLRAIADQVEKGSG